MPDSASKTFSLFKKPSKILFVAAEVHPYATVGGLGMVIFSLSRALRKMGQDVRIFMPKYGQIDEKKYSMDMVFQGLKVPTGEEVEDKKFLICNIKKHVPKAPSAPVYFLENMEYYEKRSNVYGYSDDPTRFTLLSRGILEFLKKSDWVPDIINCSDWHTGALPNYLETVYKNDPNLQHVKTIFSVHNLSHQGVFDHRFVSELDFDDGKSRIAPFFSDKLPKQNFMRRGIIYADIVNTVSRTYSKEILTEEYGEKLHDLLKEVRTKLFGVLNGLDYQALNPATDKLIQYNFNIYNLKNRSKNKIYLQKEFNLKVSPNIPLLGMVGRLCSQKGIDLLFPILENLISEFNVQFISIGGGEAKYRTFFEEMSKKFPQSIGCHLMFNLALARRVFAGCDLFLMPSRFEPCGITQMEAMRYGAIPVVRKTGGLADTVADFDPTISKGNGFVFENFDSYAFFGAIVRALETYKYEKVWRILVNKAMRADFSWDASAREYLKLYKKALLLVSRK